MKAKITVLGAGSWGTALAKLLSENGNYVTVWDKDEDHLMELSNKRVNKKYLPDVKIPSDIIYKSNIDDAVKDAEIILLVIPTQYIRSVLKLINTEYKENKIIVNH